MTARAILHKYSPAFLRRLTARVESSPLGGRLARGAFWSLAGSLISRGLGLIAAILVGRILGRVEFGEFGVIQNTIGMFGVLAGFGMSITANKHVAEFKVTDPERAGRILSMSSLVAWITSSTMALLLALAAPWVADRMLAAPHLEPILRVSALLMLLSGVNGAQGGALSGFEAFKPLARISLLTGLLSFPITLAFAWKLGLEGAVWALVANQSISCLMCHWAVRRECASHGIVPRLTGSMGEAKLFWRFSVPAVMTGLISNFASWGASVLVVHQEGGYSDMGLFNAVMRVKAVPELLLAMLLAPILPVLSEAFGKQDQAVFHRTLLSSFMLALVIIIPVSLVQLAAPILPLLPYGGEFQGGAPIVQWLMIHSVMYALLYPMGSILISTGSMWTAWFLALLYAIVYLGLAWFLVPKYGAAGYAASMTIAYGVANIPGVAMLYSRYPDMVKVLRLGWLTFGTAILIIVCLAASYTLSTTTAVLIGVAAGFACVFLKLWLYASRTHQSA